MRRSLALLLTCAALFGGVVASCSDGGTGVGTAPPQAGPCPAEPPVAGTSCDALQVCRYPQCAPGGACPPHDLVAVCPFAGGAWVLEERGDGGTFLDAGAPEVSDDAGDDATEETGEDAADDAGEGDAGEDAASETGGDAAGDAAEDALAEDALTDDAADAG